MIKLCTQYTIWPWSAQSKVTPIPMVKAKGVYFWDADGKRYFDLNSQLMCSNIGHGRPKVIEAIKKQAEELTYAGPTMATKARAEIGPILAKYTPGDLNKFFFVLGGAEANENAIKFAKFHTGRSKIISYYRSYHGGTLGGISLTGDPRRWPNEPSIMPGVVRTFNPFKYRSHFNNEGDSDQVVSDKYLQLLDETIMYENPQNIAAVFLEPVVGSNGVIIPPDGYLQGLRKLCDKYGILLICDEVMCGLGRTGKWFAVDHWKVVPDIITMAKGLTSAYLPLGSVAVSTKIAKSFEDKVFSGGLTYQCHPMCLATAIANLKVMEDEDIVGNANRVGIVLAQLLSELKSKHPSVGDVRSIGLFGIIEFVKNRKTKEPMAPYNSTSEAMTKLSAFLRDNGIYGYIHWHKLHTNPPLCVTENELREVFKIIDDGLKITDKYVEN
jgi:taurine--2-oxoglutarate transaminase